MDGLDKYSFLQSVLCSVVRGKRISNFKVFKISGYLTSFLFTIVAVYIVQVQFDLQNTVGDMKYVI